VIPGKFLVTFFQVQHKPVDLHIPLRLLLLGLGDGMSHGKEGDRHGDQEQDHEGSHHVGKRYPERLFRFVSGTAAGRRL
jgi:hypothetical protein